VVGEPGAMAGRIVARIIGAGIIPGGMVRWTNRRSTPPKLFFSSMPVTARRRGAVVIELDGPGSEVDEVDQRVAGSRKSALDHLPGFHVGDGERKLLFGRPQARFLRPRRAWISKDISIYFA